MSTTIVVIGPVATGKSTVARLIASALSAGGFAASVKDLDGMRAPLTPAALRAQAEAIAANSPPIPVLRHGAAAATLAAERIVVAALTRAKMPLEHGDVDAATQQAPDERARVVVLQMNRSSIDEKPARLLIACCDDDEARNRFGVGA